MSIYLGQNRIDSSSRVDDVANRRCFATLSSVGWYRVMEFVPTSTSKSYDIAGSVGSIIRFYITRRYHWTGNETHEVSLSLVYTSIKWMEEESNAVILGIDKIRYTTNSTTNKAYVDVHYILSQENQVGVNFNVYCPLDPDGINYQTQFTSKDFVAVADSPSGETVLTTYEFAANTFVSGSIAGSYGTVYYERRGNVVSLYCEVNSAPTSTWTQIATGLPKPLVTQFFVAQNGSSNNFVMGNLNTSGKLQFYGCGSHSSGYLSLTYICV